MYCTPKNVTLDAYSKRDPNEKMWERTKGSGASCRHKFAGNEVEAGVVEATRHVYRWMFAVDLPVLSRSAPDKQYVIKRT